MGEARYYTKIRFKSEEDAKEAYPKIKGFFLEGVEAENWWQNNRGISRNEIFWNRFEVQFPNVSEYLKFINKWGQDYNNGLAGVINFGSEDDVNERMCLNGKEIWYDAMVWHFAKWDFIKEFIECHFWDCEMKWLSDEYVDYYDLL